MEVEGVSTTGRLLREWRGTMKLERACTYATDALGHEVSRELIRRYEVKVAEEDMEPAIVGVLVTIYGKKISDLPPYMASKVERVKEVFTALSRCTAA